MSTFQVLNCWRAGSGGGSSTDPHFSSVKLLLGFNGVDGATTTSDEGPLLRGAAGFSDGAQLTTAQAKFGSASLLLAGSDDHLTYSPSGDWNYSTSDDFTMEAWVRFNSTAGDQCICSRWDSGFESWSFQKASTGAVQFVYWTGSTAATVDGAWTPSTNTWYHVAVDKAGTTMRMYADGVMLGKATSIPSFTTPAIGMKIGTVGGPAFSQLNDFNGWIDELRITKGVARYASDSGYTVPTAAFPRV